MEHPFLPTHGGAHAVGVAHIAHENVHLVSDFGRQGVDPAKTPERIVQAESADLFAAFHKLLRQMTADKPIGAGNKNGV